MRVYPSGACLRPPVTFNMLTLVRAFVGSPSSTFHYLCLPTESLLVSPFLPFIHPHPYNSSQLYPSADTVVILDATSLRLVRTLAFSQVFPNRDHVSARITSLAVDPALKLVCTSLPITMRFPLIHTFPQVAAPSGPRLAVWSLSGVSARTWLVHSSLILPDDKHITALDCRSGESAFATMSSLPWLTCYRPLGRHDAIIPVCIHFDHGE
jgi:hypothetical protein